MSTRILRIVRPVVESNYRTKNTLVDRRGPCGSEEGIKTENPRGISAPRVLTIWNRAERLRSHNNLVRLVGAEFLAEHGGGILRSRVGVRANGELNGEPSRIVADGVGNVADGVRLVMPNGNAELAGSRTQLVTGHGMKCIADNCGIHGFYLVVVVVVVIVSTVEKRMTEMI